MPPSAALTLDGDVQIEDAYVGGEKAGKRGWGKPIYPQLRRVSGFIKVASRDYATANISRTSRT